MCGICGLAPIDRNSIPEENIIASMCQALRYRGPDDAGMYLAPGIGLGHQRLKIIDLETGAQPMRDASGRFSLAFNGEVYNYRELREELKTEGFSFRTQSDTEVLLYGLIAHELGFLHRVNGMFAFALWDERERTLLLGRDRLGIKPLYWGLRPSGDLIFASEPSAMVAAAPELNLVDRRALGFFLGLSYIPGEQSIYSGIKRLLPGHWLRFDAEKGKVEQGRWWRLLDMWQKNSGRVKSPGEWQEEFLALLDDAVRVRLKSDVPLGAFLSGGIDSSTIVALMAGHSPQVRTFSMAFADSSHNEAPQARATSAFLGTLHHEGLSDAGTADLLLRIIKRLDEPFADTSIVPTQALCEMACKEVTVTLSGDGGDELLAGYITLHADKLYQGVRRLPASLIKFMRLGVNMLPDSRRKINFVFKAKQFLAAYPKDACDAHAWWRMLLTAEQLADLLGENGPDLFAPFRAAWCESEGLPPLDRFLYVDYMTWLADDILVKADRAGMSCGLELRAPFYDYRLIELCAGMPAECKRRGATGKIILRDIARGKIPDAVLDSPKKGFNAPVSQWMCAEWRELAEAAFANGKVAAHGLNPVAVSRLWQEHKNGRADHGFRLFTLLVYLLWREK